MLFHKKTPIHIIYYYRNKIFGWKHTFKVEETKAERHLLGDSLVPVKSATKIPRVLEARPSDATVSLSCSRNLCWSHFKAIWEWEESGSLRLGRVPLLELGEHFLSKPFLRKFYWNQNISWEHGDFDEKNRNTLLKFSVSFREWWNISSGSCFQVLFDLIVSSHLL